MNFSKVKTQRAIAETEHPQKEFSLIPSVCRFHLLLCDSELDPNLMITDGILEQKARGNPLLQEIERYSPLLNIVHFGAAGLLGPGLDCPTTDGLRPGLYGSIPSVVP